MGDFLAHHHGIIRFTYSCFDRILFNVFVPAWQCAAALAGEKPSVWNRKAYKYYYIAFNDLGLAGIVIEPTDDLIRFQQKLIAPSRNGSDAGSTMENDSAEIVT